MAPFPAGALVSGRVLPLTKFVSVDDVIEALGVKRCTAYAHLRQAARRGPGARGLLRVPLLVWARSVAEVVGWESSSAGRSTTATSTRTASGSSGGPAATTRPRR